MNCIQIQRSESPPLVVTHKRRRTKVSTSPRWTVEETGSQNYPANSAVYIRNLYKRYGSGPPVLENLCLNVRKGTIYGLLGASGSGKTTCCEMIVGLRKWDTGELFVFGKKPGSAESGIPGNKLGYMPQDLALYNHLSIREMIQFYGRIYNMTTSEVSERWTFLNRLLNLPTQFKHIGDLSGGMKRRVSLGLALIHCPELLVLDEPTVGLDPLLRRSIWNHLYKIVSTLSTTIVITTHYIEEARFSNTIGVMRKGRLLVEDTPTRLLHNFQCDLLEDVVLHLCRQSESSLKNVSNSISDGDTGNKVTFTSSWKQDVSSSVVLNDDELMDGIFRKAVGFDCELSQNLRRKEEDINDDSFFSQLRYHPLYKSFQRIRGLTTVIMLTFMRHPIFIALILMLPTIHGSLTLATLGTKPEGLKVGVINNELHNWTTECESPKHHGNSCDFSALSCKFLNFAREDNLLNLVPFSSKEEARNDVHLGRLWGYFSFPVNYSQHTLDLIAAKHYAFNESIVGSRISICLDNSEYVGAYFMIKHLFASYGDYVKQLAEACQIGGKEAELPINFRKPVYGHNNDNYTEFLIPGVILCCLMGVLTVLTSVIFITDRKQGTLSRARVAGLGTADVMMSHMITQGIVVLGQVVLWSLVLHIGFGLVIAGSMWLYLIICLLSGLCGAAMGILLGILCADEVEAMVFGVFWIPVLLLFGGVFWPMESMSKFWQIIGSILPTTLPITSLRSVIVRGVGLEHPLVWPGVAIIVGWTVVLSICVVIAYKKFAK